MTNKDTDRVLVLGLDGATWNILIPLTFKGIMPNLKDILGKSSWGYLLSTTPPLSAPAWFSFATGLNPGKTGVIDFFVRRNEKEICLSPLSSTLFKGRAIWDFATALKIYTGVFHYPCLYPPYRIKGFMVSGIGTPREDESITWPKQLYSELLSVICKDKYKLYIGYRNYVNHEKLLMDILDWLNDYSKALLYLVRNRPWNLFIAIVSCTDWVQHALWYVLEKILSSDKKENSKLYKLMMNFWNSIDKLVGDIVYNLRKNDILMLVSDHGFGPLKGAFNISRWLIKHKYMRKTKKSIIINTAKKILKHLPKSISKKTTEIGKNILKVNTSSIVNYARSKAYTLGHTWSCGGIYINASDIEEYGKIKRNIIKDLLSYFQGICKVDVIESRKIYHGEKIKLLPDLLVSLDDYSYLIIEDLYADFVCKQCISFNNITGTHRRKGIFLAYGQGVRENNFLGDIMIYDVMPTIMHLFNMPIPSNVDGKVLFNLFVKDSEYFLRKPRYISSHFYLTKLKVLKFKL